MDMLPNIHLIGVFIVAMTVVYRRKALYPIYIFVFITGLFNGFNTWWTAYLYTWTVLWGMTMLLPKKMPNVLRRGALQRMPFLTEKMPTGCILKTSNSGRL